MAKKNILYRSKLKNAKNLLSENKLDEANEILSRLSKQAPRDADIWLCLGFIAGKNQEYQQAIAYFGKAVAIEPGNSKALYNYGIALRDAGKIDEAIEAFKKSLVNDKGNTETLDCLAHAYMMTGHLDEAAEVFQTALKITPGSALTHSNLGSVYQAKGLLGDAEACYRTALKINPLINISENLGSVLVSQGRFDESVEVYREGLTKQPDNSKLFSNYLLTLNYLVDMPLQETYKEHKRFGSTFELKSNETASNEGLHENDKIKIAYCSPDFREHSVAHFVEPVFDKYDRNTFEVYAYNISPKYDQVTRRLRRMVDHWRDVSSRTTNEIAEMIRNDRIDILVDLAGHTAHNNLLTFAEKPAPVQINYLGYPNTTGMSSIGYRFTDNYADPPDQDQYYTESLIRLPNAFLCYRPDDNAPDVSGPPCISNKYVTFGSFNNLSKININVISTWSEILLTVEKSRLLIKNSSLTDDKTREQYYDLFGKHGINRERVELIGHTKTRFDHLSLYNNIDIALDTFPYNGTTTTCEALWMGVPVVTQTGNRHASRVGYSLLSAADCLGWVANNRNEYLDISRDLATMPDELTEIRRNQRSKIRDSLLCNSDKFINDLESTYTDLLRLNGYHV